MIGQKFLSLARSAAQTKDAELLHAVADTYRTYRDHNLEPHAGADDEMAAILEGFITHKGATQ